VPKKRRGSGRPEGPRRFEIDGFLVLVGRNARQNDDITFKQAGPTDLWLHVRGMPGAHVIIKRGKREVPERVIEYAAVLAAHYSPARDGQAPVDVTERRFVRRISGSRPGLVTYQNERTIQVEAKLPEKLLRK
jgi:predicted ribosome quality control (RQC) complex YloA/Tae2 family protein